MRDPMGFMGRAFGGDLEQVSRISSLLLRSTGCYEPRPFSLLLAFLWFLSHANPLGLLGGVGQKSASGQHSTRLRKLHAYFTLTLPPERNHRQNRGRCDKDEGKLFSLPCLPSSMLLLVEFLLHLSAGTLSSVLPGFLKSVLI